MKSKKINNLLNIKTRKNTKNNNNKKSALIIFCGLPRTFKKTSINIYENIINCNRDYNFSIIISTDNTFIERNDVSIVSNRNKVIDLYNTYLNNLEVLENDLSNCYNTDNSKLIKILYKPLKDIAYHPSITAHRLLQCLEYCDSNNLYFDRYIYTRPDIEITNKIILKKYYNIFRIIPGNLAFYNKTPSGKTYYSSDFDLMWIGSKKTFLKWAYPYIYTERGIEYKNNNYIVNSFLKMKKPNLQESNEILKKYKWSGWECLVESNNFDFGHNYAKFIYFLEKNNIIFYDFSDRTITTKIIR